MVRGSLKVLGFGVGKAEYRTVPLPRKVGDKHYDTPAHRQWASLVIGRARGRCQDPECKGHRVGERLYADHIVELRDDPSKAFDLNNGMARCASCHTRKTYRERALRVNR